MGWEIPQKGDLKVGDLDDFLFDNALFYVMMCDDDNEEEQETVEEEPDISGDVYGLFT